MAKYDFELDVCTDGGCGWSHFETAYGEVELTDEEVQCLVDLIRENDGETDPDALGLEDRYPDIYDKLYDASYSAIKDAHEETALINGFKNYYDEPDDLMERCEKDLGFTFDPDEEPDMDKEDAFDVWLDDYFYGLDREEQASFMKEYYRAENMYEPQSVEVVIPEDIIYLAEDEDEDEE